MTTHQAPASLIPPEDAILTTQAPSQLWTATLGRLQLEVPRANFETLLKGTQALRFDDDCLVIGTESAFAATWLEERLAGPLVVMFTIASVCCLMRGKNCM
jgi:hypothetical protein